MGLDIDNVNETVSDCVILPNLFQGLAKFIPPHWYGIPFQRIKVPPGANQAIQRSATKIRNAIDSFFVDDQDALEH